MVIVAVVIVVVVVVVVVTAAVVTPQIALAFSSRMTDAQDKLCLHSRP